jgi:hypothetical protein
MYSADTREEYPVISLASWRDIAQGGRYIPRDTYCALQQLQFVKPAEVAARAPKVARVAAQLLQRVRAVGNARLATTVDALGSAADAHPRLLAAFNSDAAVAAAIDQTFDAAAKQSQTYDNPHCTSQLATA